MAPSQETVSSKPEVIRRVNAECVPLTLRAPLVNGAQGAGADAEGRLYARLKRAMLAPQGIGILFPGGCVLAWVQMFDDSGKILRFLDDALPRNATMGVGAAHAVTERYLRFTSEKVEPSSPTGS
ncbi:MAG: hypothetical protein HYZ53_17620 [Planctomycetes bacterium]|nr:hypothetical protein [Planctomycetota bacterium]